MPPRAMPPQPAGIGTTLPPAMMAAAGQLPTGIGPLPPDAMHPMMRPPVIKVIDTPEEAAKMLQHHPAKEHRCTLLKLKSLTVAAGAGNSESEAQLEQQSALTLDLSPLDQDSGIELDDWIECCATAPPATDPVLASGGAAAYSGGGFVAFGCADGEILLLKSGAAGEETVESARFLAHGDADLNFEAATMSLCFSPPLAQDVAATAEGSKQPGCSRVAIFTRMLASSGEDGRLRVWSVDSVLSKGKGDTTQSLRCEVSGLDGEGADYRRRGGRGSESVRVPSVQLVACAPSVHPTATDGDVGAGNVPNLAVAVGRSLWLVELSRDWCSHRSSVQLGNIHSTATDLRFAELPELGTGTALLAACYGAVSIWDAPTLQRSVQTQAQQAPSRRLDYKGPLLGLSVSTGGAFVGAGCQDATMHVWRIPGVTNGKARAAAIATAIASTSDSAVQPMPMVEDAVTAIAGEEERVAVIPKPAVRKSAAAAAITEVSCGGYAEKVICNEWSTGGLFLATAGGQHAIVWDFTQDDDDDAKDKAKGGCAFTFPVGKKEAAAICYGHERRVTAIAFGPHAVDPQTKSVRLVLLASASISRESTSCCAAVLLC
jgi:WD40 repeat protein